MTIEHPEKFGIATWEIEVQRGAALNDLELMGFSWYYTFSTDVLYDADPTPETSEFVAMLWDETWVNPTRLEELRETGATTLLPFNEPEVANQANMTVSEALDLWPQLQATGLRLGSPAVAEAEALGSSSWLGQFMAGAEERGFRVDFIAVHYYSDDGSAETFRSWLEAVHDQYQRPVWVTEWALADWRIPGGATFEQQAAFARASAEMMDDLPFVERHAWFSAYGGGISETTALWESSRHLTAVGQAFDDLLHFNDWPEFWDGAN